MDNINIEPGVASLSSDITLPQCTKKHHARSALEVTAQAEGYEDIDLDDINNDVCDEVAGNTRAGKFLAKLVRWYRFTKIERGEHKWVALTQAEWAEECNLTVDQIRRILTRLGRDGLLVREQHLFKNKNVLFVRLSNACKAALCDAREGQLEKYAARDAAKIGRRARTGKRGHARPIERTTEQRGKRQPAHLFLNLSEKQEKLTGAASADAFAVPFSKKVEEQVFEKKEKTSEEMIEAKSSAVANHSQELLQLIAQKPIKPFDKKEKYRKLTYAEVVAAFDDPSLDDKYVAEDEAAWVVTMTNYDAALAKWEARVDELRVAVGG